MNPNHVARKTLGTYSEYHSSPSENNNLTNHILKTIVHDFQFRLHHSDSDLMQVVFKFIKSVVIAHITTFLLGSECREAIDGHLTAANDSLPHFMVGIYQPEQIFERGIAPTNRSLDLRSR